mgnify:CR=1 FL=1
MSTNLHRLIENFTYWTQALAPTNTTVRNRFEVIDPFQYPEPPTDSAGLRKFYIEYMGSAEDLAATDLDNREAWHSVRQHVWYPTCLPFNTLQMMVIQDRHDLVKRGRDSTYQKGYDSSHTATDFGLMRRLRKADTINRQTGAALWILSIEWLCFSRESEQ